MHRKIATIDISRKSNKVKTSAKKAYTGKKRYSNNKSKEERPKETHEQKKLGFPQLL